MKLNVTGDIILNIYAPNNYLTKCQHLRGLQALSLEQNRTPFIFWNLKTAKELEAKLAIEEAINSDIHRRKETALKI